MKMEKRFYFEIIVGIIGIVAVLIWGMAGFAAFALFALYPLFAKEKADEREYQLFYKAGNASAVFTFLLCILIYFLSDVTVMEHSIGDLWLFLVCFSYLVAHGISGIVVFRKV